MDLNEFIKWRESQGKIIMTGLRHNRVLQDEQYYDDERKFVAEFNNKNKKADYEISMLIHGSGEGRNYDRPKEWVTDKEKEIIMTVIQWLGTPVGKSFLGNCGFTKKLP